MSTNKIDPNIAFRKNDLVKAKDLISLGESFNVVGKEGVGKSRFLRHMAYQPSFLNEFEKDQVLIAYFDLRKTYHDLRHGINNELGKSLEKPTKSLDQTLEQLFTTYNKIYLIFDESMLLTKHDLDEVNDIRALRDFYKYRLNFIFAYNKKEELNYDINSLHETAKYTISLNTLGKEDMLDTIKYIMDSYNISLDANELEEIVYKSKGYPGKARSIILEKILGKANEGEKLNLEPIKILEEALYYLTKNEYLVLKAMLDAPNYFIEKDEISKVLSPESAGIGVSDASISQTIKRLRTKLTENRANIEIKTKRGFGYYIG